MSFFNQKKATLALADGKILNGHSFGADINLENASIGEVVFNTSMSGYQEILTDPSYAGQIMTFTNPQIGNVGTNPEDNESCKIHTEAVVIRNHTLVTSNFRSELSFSEFLKKQNIAGIAGIDTRELVKHLRDNGSQTGAIATGDVNPDDLVDLAKKAGGMEGKNYVKKVTSDRIYAWNELPWELGKGYQKLSSSELDKRPHVVAIDCGVKFNILRLLTESGFRVTVVPAYTPASEINQLEPDGIFLSNGPGDPATLPEIVSTVSDLLGKYPIFGICLGNQILAQALGAKTYKLKFGHRGGNHPVKDLTTGKIEITVQNHGFAVDDKSLNSDIKLSHINLNDNTVEGVEVPEQKCFSVQYHPEANPGPRDASYLFDRFYNLVVK